MNLRYPNITATNPEGQLAQMKSYIYQLVEELNITAGNLGGSGTGAQDSTGPSRKTGKESPGDLFDSIKALIIKSSDIVNSYYAQMEGRISQVYVARSDFGDYVEINNAEMVQQADLIEQTVANLQLVLTELEGLEAEIVEANSRITQKATEIEASVSRTEASLSESIGSLEDSVSYLRREVTAKMTEEDVEIKIRSEMENGVSSVVTSTGFTFDREGLTVSKSGSELQTKITEDGMTVYEGQTPVLTADSSGVEAFNLHATTFLTVGARSRFENYGSNRTGCFWIGG